MRKPLITFVVAALVASSASALPRRTVYPGTLDASVIAEMNNNPITRSDDSDATMRCIVRFADDINPETIVSTYDARVNTITGKLATVLIPSHRLMDFACDNNVVSISAGSVVRAMSDEAARLSNVDKIQSLQTPYTGKGVIIGVIDSGFDFGHAAFKDASGRCRITAVWDQTRSYATVGHSSDFGYGIVVDTPEDIASLAHDLSFDTHGTHVAAIAASSADIYHGMAPDAELVLVSTDKSEAGMVDGLKFLLDYADDAGKPIAVNISMGTVIGFKDGNDNLAAMIDILADNQLAKIVSIAAGNEGHRRSTIVSQPEAEGFTTRLVPPSYNRENLFVGASDGDFRLTLTLRDSQGQSLYSCDMNSDATESFRHDNFTAPADGSFVAMSSAKNPITGAASVSVILYAPLTQGSYWEAEVKGNNAKYIMTADYGELTEGSTATTIACTACGRNTVSVGAYVSRPKFVNLDGNECTSGWSFGEEYPNSGKGPTFDGRIKPEIMAPGASVISAINSYASSFSVSRDDLVVSRTGDNRTDFWGAMSGTSMATPVVTGVIALWLEANPQLTISQVHDLLTRMNTLDALKGIEALTSGLDESILDQNGNVDVYDILGNHLRSSHATTALDGLKPGIYIVCKGSKTKKVAVGL